jgi:ribosomal protein L11 methyltransferase
VTATGAQVSEAGILPAGLLVEGDLGAITAAFASLSALQPVRLEPEGLVCSPRCAPELAAPALADCPLPTRALATVPGWPTPPAAQIAGWYRRSPDHLRAPEGVRELIQAAGEGFGPGDHATTAMCLEAIDALPAGDAVDAGCGSGLLSQAWVALGRGSVVACDLDPRAVDQARRSLEAAGRRAEVDLRQGPLSALAARELAGRTVLANVPLPAHHALLERVGAPPRTVVLSGIREPQVAALEQAWSAHGLHAQRILRRNGFACLWMEGPE